MTTECWPLSGRKQGTALQSGQALSHLGVNARSSSSLWVLGFVSHLGDDAESSSSQWVLGFVRMRLHTQVPVAGLNRLDTYVQSIAKSPTLGDTKSTWTLMCNQPKDHHICMPQRCFDLSLPMYLSQIRQEK